MFHFLKLSTVKILPNNAVQVKKSTRGGILVFQILFQKNKPISLGAKALKYDLNLNPFLEDTLTLLSIACPLHCLALKLGRVDPKNMKWNLMLKPALVV